MDGSLFPVSILIDFEEDDFPVSSIQEDVLKLLLSVQQNMLGSDESIIVNTPNHFNLSFLHGMKEDKVQPNYTDDMDELFNSNVEIVSVFTDKPHYAAKVGVLCKENDIFCNRKVFTYHETDRVQEKTEGEGLVKIRRPKNPNKKPPAPKEKTIVVKDAAGLPRDSLPTKTILRKDAVVQSYHVRTQLKDHKAKLEAHVEETNNLQRAHKDAVEAYQKAKGTESEPDALAKTHEAYEALKGRDEHERLLRDKVSQQIAGVSASKETHEIEGLIHEMRPETEEGSKNKHPYLITRASPKGTLTLYDNVYEGQPGPLSPMGIHRWMKSGGASEKMVEDLARLAIDRLLHDGNEVPDRIVTPPITWEADKFDDKGKLKTSGDATRWNSPEQKAATQLHVRTAEKMVELLKDSIAIDKVSGKRVSLDDFKRKLVNAKSHEVDAVFDSIDFRSPEYDPMFMGTKDFQVKNVGAREVGLDLPQPKKKLKKGEVETEAHPVVQPTRREMIESQYKEALLDFYTDPGKSVAGQNVLLLDDNVDSGATLTFLKHNMGFEATPEGTNVSTIALFNMGARPVAPEGIEKEKPGYVKSVTGHEPSHFDSKEYFKPIDAAGRAAFEEAAKNQKDLTAKPAIEIDKEPRTPIVPKRSAPEPIKPAVHKEMTKVAYPPTKTVSETQRNEEGVTITRLPPAGPNTRRKSAPKRGTEWEPRR
jgi:hypothetical protein